MDEHEHGEVKRRRRRSTSKTISLLEGADDGSVKPFTLSDVLSGMANVEVPDLVDDDGMIHAGISPVMPPVLNEVVPCHRCGQRMISTVRRMKQRETFREYPTLRCTRKGCQTFMSISRLMRLREQQAEVAETQPREPSG